MKFSIREISSWGRAINHLAFWSLCILLFTLAWGYGAGVPGGYKVSFVFALIIMPVHILYFYSVAYLIIPTFLYDRNYQKLILALCFCSIAAAFLFRATEIFIADPYLLSKILEDNPAAKWEKVQGTISQQFLKSYFIINAFEQSNIIVWIAISVKFFKMWYEKKQVALQTELNFLKGQLHPHFLFNTLNNLYALTLKQSPKSPSIVLGLSDILRYMLHECNTNSVLLSRDIEILESYISLEKIRYEERLDLTLSITGSLKGQFIAPLLMLPLVENAFKHGTSEMIEDAWVNVDIQVFDEKLIFKVSNGKPMKLPKNNELHFSKIGLSNVRKRLELLYKDAFEFNVYDEEDIFVAILEVDLKRNLNIINSEMQSKLQNGTSTRRAALWTL